MSRPSWNTLGHYNAKQPGTVQGPMVSPSIPSMKKQKPLYPLVKPGYNSLVYNGTGTAYYRVNEGPYGAWKNKKCSTNNFNRECWGGGPVLGSQRENYGTATGKQLITRLTFPNPLWGTYQKDAKVKQVLACADGVPGHAAPGFTCPATGYVKATVKNSRTVDVVTTKGTFASNTYSPEMCPPTTAAAPYPCPVTIGGVQVGFPDTAKIVSAMTI